MIRKHIAAHFFRMNVAYPLSLPGLARAEALQGDTTCAQQYQAFFDYWKNVDPDLPPQKKLAPRLPDSESKE